MAAPKKALGPDPSQQPQQPAMTRPGDDRPLQLPPSLPPGWTLPEPPPLPVLAPDDAALLTRRFRAEAGHVGNWPKGSVIPPGTFTDPAWVRELVQRRCITPIDEAEAS